jgi:ElaB/YqjD/DUF883 family membrane-anchored ribosome-binding protein
VTNGALLRQRKRKERHIMADTDDMAPGTKSTAAATSPKAAARRRSAPARRTTASRARRAVEPDLEDQVDRLQSDMKAIMKSLQRLGNEKVGEVQGRAKSEYANLLQTGEGMLDSVTDEFTQVERQIKDTIRQKPLTAVLSAVGIGFLIAVLTR